MTTESITYVFTTEAADQTRTWLIDSTEAHASNTAEAEDVLRNKFSPTGDTSPELTVYYEGRLSHLLRDAERDGVANIN